MNVVWFHYRGVMKIHGTLKAVLKIVQSEFSISSEIFMMTISSLCEKGTILIFFVSVPYYSQTFSHGKKIQYFYSQTFSCGKKYTCIYGCISV